MIYEDIVKKAVQAAKKVNKDAIEEHLAVEFDIEGRKPLHSYMNR